ncbi:PREDICTED: protein bfr2-like [Tarenaya hassleriana]|uniref:protein bfr2-like n=1 Tax=Tarenaya hassleriana TaxID=28532 RepID=UPI00053C7A14|nr:PREDICTED: protein bfr2-like [Tarenaya hassleriana]
MSWLARSLANSIRLDEEDDDGDDEEEEEGNLENDAVSDNEQSSTRREDSLGNANLLSSSPEDVEEEAHARGVKDDLTELGQSLTRKWRGVANFLAPLPDAAPRFGGGGSSIDLSDSGLNRTEPPDWSESRAVGDLPEIEDRAGRLNTEKTEMALDYRPFRSVGDDEEDDGEFEEEEEEEEETEEEEEEEEEEEIDAVGVTDEVLAFARNIAMHPETWLDFPLDPEEDLDDFNMSDAQQGHALAIERLAPRLAALRIELCPCHMSVGYFWKVYFVLLHSRLQKRDAEILSSPQVMEARALWMKELQKQTNPETDWFGRSISNVKESRDIRVEVATPSSSSYFAPPEFLSPRIYAFEPPSIMTHDYQTVKHMSGKTEAQFIDKAVIEEEPPPAHKKDTTIGRSPEEGYDDDDDWPEEEDYTYGRCPKFTVNEEDVSFSDLEGDDDISSIALKSKTISKGS